MGQMSSCCLWRRDSSEAFCFCDVNNSLFGEDAFYRDAFFDCEEGDQSHDWLFTQALEQPRLKYRKAGVFGAYAGFLLGQTVRDSLSTPSAGTPSAGGRSCREAYRRPRLEWVGKTLPEWTKQGLPDCSEGALWKKGEGDGLRVRCGPNYRKTGQKTDSSGSLYEAVSCDAIKADVKITDIMGRIVDLSSLPKPRLAEGDMSGGDLTWTTSCPVPRILCINLMLPYKTGVTPFGGADGGCSFVGMFQIKQKTLEALRSGEGPKSLELWKKFCKGPCGQPGDRESKDRSLAQRLVKGIKKDQHSGLFKCTAKCDNPEDLSVPDLFHTYNGKPCLITKCGYVVKDPAGEWIEIGVDVRGFNILARKMLCSFRNLLPLAKIHYGFLIQGVEDDEMPEGMLCDMYVCGVNMIDDPLHIGEV